MAINYTQLIDSLQIDKMALGHVSFQALLFCPFSYNYHSDFYLLAVFTMLWTMAHHAQFLWDAPVHWEIVGWSLGLQQTGTKWGH